MKLLVTGLALALASLTWSQSLKLETYSLPNGMKVILHEDHALPMVTVNILYRVGSKDEPDHRSGFAHLFEHLMFMGTDRVPTGQYDAIMEGGGGWNNADTTEDRTDFFDVGPSNLLPTLLWLEADRLETLGKNMTQKKLDLQRDVVKNERRQTTENTPYGKAYETINGLMFPPLHPYHTSVIGSMEDLDNATVQDVQNFFATFYVPNNASMVIAGDFRPEQVKPLIASLFGTLPRANDVPRKFVPDPSFSGVKRITYVDAVQASKVVLIWHAPKEYAAGDADLNLAASILSDGLTSRLYQRLVVKDKIATDVSASVDDRSLGSLFTIDATAADGVALDRLEHAIKEEVHRLGKEGPTASELKRAVAKVQFGIVNGLQSVQGVADQLNEFDAFFGQPNGFRPLLERYREVTPASLSAWVRRTLGDDGYADMRVVPQSAAPTGPNPRNAQPVLGGSKPFSAPLPQTFTLSNGLKVEFWRRPNVPLMSLLFRSKQGAAGEANAKNGVSLLMAEMMSEGTVKDTAQDFQNSLDALGAQFSASADVRSTSASLNVLTSNFAPALTLFRDALRTPRFDSVDLERSKRVAIANIQNEDDDPASVAGRVLNRAYFGEGTPLGRPLEGTVQTVGKLTRADLVDAFHRQINPAEGTLYVAGSLDMASVKAQLERAFSGWHGTREPEPKLPTPDPKPTRVLIVDRPGAVQTVVRFVFPAAPLSSPDRQAVTSLATVLGGSFTSRLNHNLREDKGYTYGAGDRYSPLPGFGTFSAEADVRADVTGASIKEFLSEFKKISTGDVTAAEATKTSLTRRQEMVNGLESLSGLLGTAARLDLDGRSFAAFGPELEGAMAVTAADMNRVAPQALPLDRMLLVLVGDKAAILKQLAGLGLPEPTVVTP